MGQYHVVCNLDRKEYLHPHRLGDGLKLREFSRSQHGTMTALAYLLAGSVRGGARGGGDFRPMSKLALALAGRWSGDRIAIIGDYYAADDVRGCDPSVFAGVWRDDGDWVDISEHL